MVDNLCIKMNCYILVLNPAIEIHILVSNEIIVEVNYGM